LKSAHGFVVGEAFSTRAEMRERCTAIILNNLWLVERFNLWLIGRWYSDHHIGRG